MNNTAPEGAGWFVQQGLLTVGDNTVVANTVGSKDGGGGASQQGACAPRTLRV